jgi:hypothetical protein
LQIPASGVADESATIYGKAIRLEVGPRAVTLLVILRYSEGSGRLGVRKV